MRTSKYILRTSLMACFVSCCISFASADNPPFFTTDIKLNDKGEMLLTEKGMKRVDVFSADGKLLRSFPMDETPTGILVDGDKAYVTTFEKTGKLQILLLESGRVEAASLQGRVPAIRCSDRIKRQSMSVTSSKTPCRKLTR